MSFRTFGAALGGAALALVLAAGTAAAWPAQTTGSLNVRTGPGVGFPKVGALPLGSPVDVQFCQGSWCSVGYWGGGGWVSANYLTSGPGFAPGHYPRKHHRHDGFFVSVGPGGVLIGPGARPWVGPGPWPAPAPFPYPYPW